jgi:hypothetical protein
MSPTVGAQNSRTGTGFAMEYRWGKINDALGETSDKL